MSTVMATIMLIASLLVAGCGRAASTTSQQPKGGQNSESAYTVAPNPKGDPVGPVVSREQAIKIATGGRTDGNWDAILMKDYVPPFEGKVKWQPRDTWIVQRLHPGPNETVWVDAKTGEPYLVRQSEAPAPMSLPNNEQSTK